MPKRPRLADVFGTDLALQLAIDANAPPPKRVAPKRRPLVTHDGTMIVQGESYAIAGQPLALDARPKPSLASVTFDGAVPFTKD